MITQLSIAGFKRFANCELPMAPLTMLAGLNGAGKTSVLQALLLCREASLTKTASVLLNGPFGLELGSVLDIKNIQSSPTEIELALRFSDGEASFRLDANDDSLLYLPVLKKSEVIPGAVGGSNRMFTYLCAERLGPREMLGSSSQPDHELNVGVRGEYCAQVLDVYELREKEKVVAPRRHPEKQSETQAFLKYQVEAWLSDIVRPIEIDIAKFPGISVRAIRFRTPGEDLVRATNMGFGVSYCLPIVLAGLFTPPGGLLIVENPEAHLHPAGQSRMGTFLAILAASGVQVVVETHSDHVLNGVRRAIGEHHHLKPEQAIVHFFDVEEDGSPKVSSLQFTASGNLGEWPLRFFDQFHIDVAALARVRRKKQGE
jgi:predicted ATPase